MSSPPHPPGADPPPSLPPPPSGAGGGEPPVPKDDDELSDGEGEGLEKLDTRRASEGFVAFNKSLDDCEVTSGVSNPVKRDTVARGGKVNHAPNTPLKSIAGVFVQDLKIDDLRMFCSKNGIKGSRKAKKAPICWAIVRAKEARAAGRPGPYRNLIPEGGSYGRSHLMETTEAWGVDAPPDGTSKRRRVDEATPGIDGGAPQRPPTSPARSGGSTLPQRVGRSRERANLAIELRETIEAAATVRREVREEKERRAGLWKALVEKAGDENAAKASVLAASEASNAPGGEVKTSVATLAEDIAEQDALVGRLTKRHAALEKAVDKLLPKETVGASTAVAGAMV